MGTAVAQWLRYCVTNLKVAGSIPAGVMEFFIDTKSFRSHYGPGVDSASNRNEYQENFLVVCKADKLTTILCRCHEIWEPSGPLQACNGTDLPLPLPGKGFSLISGLPFCLLTVSVGSDGTTLANSEHCPGAGEICFELQAAGTELCCTLGISTGSCAFWSVLNEKLQKYTHLSTQTPCVRAI